MSWDEETAERVRRILSKRRRIVEKKMIGGLSFMVSGKLCCGVNRMGLLVRVGPEVRKRMLEQPHVRQMELAGRTVSSFVRVDPEAYRTDAALAKWIQIGVRYALATSRKEPRPS
jgi:TfoX/Sxy family transcriptional regulator of competence genes